MLAGDREGRGRVGSARRRKREGATGSLATLGPGRGPSHPRSTTHGSRLPAISRRGAASRVDVKLTTPKRAPQVPLGHGGERSDQSAPGGQRGTGDDAAR